MIQNVICCFYIWKQVNFSTTNWKNVRNCKNLEAVYSMRVVQKTKKCFVIKRSRKVVIEQLLFYTYRDYYTTFLHNLHTNSNTCHRVIPFFLFCHCTFPPQVFRRCCWTTYCAVCFEWHD